MNPDELRSRLAVAYPAETPPPDLAARAERTAGRIRRRRTAAVVAAAVLAVAVPLSIAAVTGPGRALPPAGPADPACTWDDRAIPRQGVVTSRAEVAAWGFRGDTALHDRALATARRNKDLADPQILYASPELVLYAARLPQDSDWTLVATRTDAAGTEIGGTTGRLAYPGPAAAVSLLVPWKRVPAPPADFAYGPNYAENLLVVLAPPGSRGVSYRGCRDGEPFTVEADGDTLVRTVGTLDAPGSLTVRNADGTIGYQGPAADRTFQPGLRPPVVLPPVEPIPVPAGLRQVHREVGQGTILALPPRVDVERATVLIRCRAVATPAPVEVSDGGQVLGAARCDGSVETVAENVPVDGTLLVGPSGQPAAVSYQLLVVSA